MGAGGERLHGGVVRVGWRRCGGGKWANYLNWVRPEDGKKSKTMGEYSSTQAQHHQRYQHQTTKLQLKSETARDENRNTMTQHRTGYALAEVCRDWFTLVLMVVTSEGLGGAKEKRKKTRRENVGVWNRKRQSDNDKTVQRSVDQLNKQTSSVLRLCRCGCVYNGGGMK